MKVAVLGAAGQMGSETCRAVEVDPDLELVAGIGRGDDLEKITRGGAEIAVEFTTPDSVKENVRFCLDHGVHVVIGATGLSHDDLTDIESWATESTGNAFVAPNFAVGAVLMMRFAAQAAPYFERAEISERHHERKLDAPSGTALRTAELMSAARNEAWAPVPESRESLPGSRGGEVDGIHIHSFRLPGAVAEQEVVLASAGETLTIRHDSLDRASFMPGVILAIKKVPSLGPFTVGLENILDL